MAQTLNVEASLNSTSDSFQNTLIDSPSTLKKLYKSLLNTEVVQTGLEKLNKVSAPVIRKLETTQDTISTKVVDTVLSTTIYNKLSELFLIQNLPYGSLSGNGQDFTHLFESLDKNNKAIYRDIPHDFYILASSEWRALENPSFGEIRDALLRAVARVLNKNLNLSDESLSQTLFNIFRGSLQKGIPTQKKFAAQVTESISEAAKAKGVDTITEAAKEYYTFARRFTFVDYPLRNGTEGWTGLAKTLIKRRALFASESSINFLEKKLDFVMDTVHVVYGGPKTANNLVERTERILRKLFVLALHPVKVSADKALLMKGNKFYISADKYLNLTDKLDNTLYYSLWGYDVLKDRVIVPSFEFVNVKIVKGKETVAYVLSGINTDTVKKNYNKLVAKYEVLRKGTVSLYDQTVKLVLSKASVGI